MLGTRIRYYGSRLIISGADNPKTVVAILRRRSLGRCLGLEHGCTFDLPLATSALLRCSCSQWLLLISHLDILFLLDRRQATKRQTCVHGRCLCLLASNCLSFLELCLASREDKLVEQCNGVRHRLLATELWQVDLVDEEGHEAAI